MNSPLFATKTQTVVTGVKEGRHELSNCAFVDVVDVSGSDLRLTIDGYWFGPASLREAADLFRALADAMEAPKT